MRDHRKFDAFVLADRLTLTVYETTKSWPRDEIFGLTAQVRRGAVSVASNIVEGCGRESDADFRHFLVMAHASCRELAYQFSIAERLEYSVQAGDGTLVEQAERTSRVLADLIKAISVKSNAFKMA